MNPFQLQRRRGVTLTELIFAVTILSGMMAAVITLFVGVIRQERTNLRMIQMTYDTSHLHREMRQLASVGGSIGTSGNQVTFFNEITGVTSQIRYEDLDGNPDTIGDNQIVLIKDVDADDEDSRIVVRYVSPLRNASGSFLPMFSRQPGRPQPLLIQFRVGDRTGPIGRTARANVTSATYDECRADDAFTGDGFQSVAFRSVIMPRRPN